MFSHPIRLGLLLLSLGLSPTSALLAQTAQPAVEVAETTEADALLQRVKKLYQQGDYATAIPLAEKALQLYRQQLGPDDPKVATALNELAGLYKSQDRYPEAEPLYKKALSIRRKSLPPDHPDIASSLNNLAGLYASQSRYPEAEPLYKKALSIRRKTLPPSHPEIAQSLNNLALLYASQGRYPEAEPFYKESLSILRKSLPPSHPAIATSLNNLAGLYESQGRYVDAEPLYKESLSILRKSLPLAHPHIAGSLNNLALLYRVQGRYPEAEPLYKESLSIYRKTLPPAHPLIAQSLNNLASLYKSQGRYPEAERLFKESLSTLRKTLPPSHPDLAVSLNNLAVFYESQDRYLEAEPLYKKSLSIYRQSLPPAHPLIAQSLNNLAILYWSRQSVSSALSTLQEGLEVEEKNLAKNLDFGNEQQKRRYLSLFSSSVDGSISLHQQLAPDHLQAQQLALTTILRRKGRLLDVQGQSRHRLRQNLTPALQTKLNQLNKLQASLSGLTNQGLRTNNPADHDKYVQDRQNLIQQIDQLEGDLSRASAELRREFNPVTVPQVQAQLPPQSVLLEFMVYTPYDPTAPTKERWGAARYIVYVLTPQGQIHTQDLGPAADLDRLIESFRKDVADVSLTLPEVQTSAQKLYSQLLKPIQPHLQSAEHLLIAPDGPLNLIPFEALVDSQSQYLVQTHQLTYLSSGRDLLRLSDPIPETQEVLVMANPDYNHLVTTTPAKESISKSATVIARVQGPFERSQDFDEQDFKSLPGTLAEGESIDKTLKHSRLLKAEQATETALKQSSTPHILHMATHGFFLEDQSLTPDSNPEDTRYQYENPLLRAGLAFVGANHLPQAPDDGILTALEVSGLNLRGTQMVVMSACETGLGEIISGEGVYGLRRAFTLAGSRSQLMSLWRVRDVSTKDLMVAYYQRLKDGQPRGKALQDVQQQMLKGEMKDEEGKTYTHPYYWAAFVRTGDWSPMNLD